MVDDRLLLLFNAHDEAIDWTMPDESWGDRWKVELDTAFEGVEPPSQTEEEWLKPGEARSTGPRSVVILRRPND